MIRPSQRHFAPENLDPRLRAGLVGHWIGGGSGLTWFDRSGRGNHGAIAGADWTLGGDHQPGLNFDGTSDYLSVPDSPSLAFGAALTCCFWFRRRGSGASAFVGKSAPANRGFFLQIASDNRLYFGGSGDGSTLSFFASSQTFTDTNWHCLAGVYDAASWVAYLDGVALSGSITGAVPATLFNSTSPFENRYDGGNWFSGILGQTRLYNKALSAAQISLLAQPSFLPVVPRRWFVGPAGVAPITTDATAAYSTWVAPAATARTRYTVPASAALSTWVAPSASAQLNRRRSISVPCSVASYSIPSSSTSYQIEVS